MAPLSGVKKFLNETKQIKTFFENYNFLRDNYQINNFKNIWNWCEFSLEQINPDQPLIHLKEAIVNHKKIKKNDVNTLAGLYFTYQLFLRNNK